MPLASKPGAPRPTNFIGEASPRGNITGSINATSEGVVDGHAFLNPLEGITRPERSFAIKRPRGML